MTSLARLARCTSVALALVAGLLVAPRLAGAQVVIQNDDDTPAPTTTAPAPPPPPPTAAPAPAPANPNLGLSPPPAPGAPPDTTDKTKVDVGPGGATVTQETVKSVKEPPSSVVNVALDIGGGTILGLSNITIGFANADLKVKILAGGKFPGPDGGMWNGIIFEPQVSLMAVAISQSQPTIIAGAQFPGNNSTSAAFGFQAGGAVGWQFLTFGTMSEGGLKQHGFGLELGGYLGATGVNPPSGSMQINASYGPVVGLSFPTYNAGTASYSSFAITFFVLPTGDGSVLLSGGLGWIF